MRTMIVIGSMENSTSLNLVSSIFKYVHLLYNLDLNNIAIQIYSLGQRKEGIIILKELKNYYETKFIDYEYNSKFYAIVLSNLCKWIYQDENYFECINLCEYSLDFAIKYNILDILIDITYYKGNCLIEIGKNVEGKELLFHSYYLAKLTKATQQLEIIKHKLHEKYNVELS